MIPWEAWVRGATQEKRRTLLEEIWNQFGGTFGTRSMRSRVVRLPLSRMKARLDTFIPILGTSGTKTISFSPI
ncbi:hypothetical protein Moror_14486 [Moniliophthora roreri MCA 2997]|uniref:Uncharacterized protein n=1 Tax=Moniliophthora roreri (strain MCA 2997) TaxID=1381753 RepID=V2W5T9_MONRO|nr:hypothetical protein Moror_14486 [Moniliophthora roreri MCA 2997]